MKFYRLDCSNNFRFVIQIKNFKIITRLREWYKLKRRVNRIDNMDISLIFSLIEDDKERVMDIQLKERYNANYLSGIYLNQLETLRNKLI